MIIISIATLLDLAIPTVFHPLLQYKHAEMVARDIATVVANFTNLKIQDRKQFGNEKKLLQLVFVDWHVSSYYSTYSAVFMSV